MKAITENAKYELVIFLYERVKITVIQTAWAFAYMCVPLKRNGLCNVGFRFSLNGFYSFQSWVIAEYFCKMSEKDINS